MVTQMGKTRQTFKNKFRHYRFTKYRNVGMQARCPE